MSILSPKRGLWLALAIAALTAAPNASATYVFDLSTLVSGSAPGVNDSSSPYLTATVKAVAPGEVQLTLDASNLATDEFIRSWLFNIDPTVTPFSVTFDAANSTLPSSVLLGTTYMSDNLSGGSNVKGGLFDMQFAYNAQGNATRFFGGNIVVLDIFSQLIDETSFNFTSVQGAPNQGTGGYYSVADIQGSGSVGAVDALTPVSEPSTLALLIPALLGAGLFVRRR